MRLLFCMHYLSLSLHSHYHHHLPFLLVPIQRTNLFFVSAILSLLLNHPPTHSVWLHVSQRASKWQIRQVRGRSWNVKYARQRENQSKWFSASSSYNEIFASSFRLIHRSSDEIWVDIGSKAKWFARYLEEQIIDGNKFWLNNFA